MIFTISDLISAFVLGILSMVVLNMVVLDIITDKIVEKIKDSKEKLEQEIVNGLWNK